MKNGKNVAIATAIMVPILLLGSGLALATEKASEAQLDESFSVLSDAHEAEGAIEGEQSEAKWTEVDCVGIGCWEPRMEPVAEDETVNSQETISDEGASNDIGIASNETECTSCDVVLLNEYPEYRYR